MKLRRELSIRKKAGLKAMLERKEDTTVIMIQTPSLHSEVAEQSLHQKIATNLMWEQLKCQRRLRMLLRMMTEKSKNPESTTT